MFKSKKIFIEVLTILFVSSILISNTIVGKTWKPIPVLDFEITAAFLFFVFPMIIGDILAEILPRKEVKKVIFYGFLMNCVMALVYTFTAKIPNSDSEIMNAYNLVLGQSFIVFFASMSGYLLGSMTNALVMWALQSRHGENKFKFRAWVSTVIGQTTDNILFLSIALGIGFGMPFKNILIIFLSETILEIIIETLCLPFTHKLVEKYKKLEK